MMRRFTLATLVMVLAIAAMATMGVSAGKQDKTAPPDAAEKPVNASKTEAGSDQTVEVRNVAAKLSTRWIDADDVRIRSQSADLSRWWHVFNDPLLDRLVEQAYRQNLTLRKARARAEQKREPLREDYDEAVLSVLADVATNYVRIRQFQEQIQQGKAIVQLQTEVLKITRARLDAGRTSELDVDEAQAIICQTEAAIHQQEAQLRQAENRLCVLLGMPPRDIDLHLGSARIPSLPLTLAVGIPWDLLQQRPGVRLAAQDTSSDYHETVLKSIEEVENGIASYLRAQDEAGSLKLGVATAQRAFQIVIGQYRVGTVDFGRVAKVERSLVEQAVQEARARAQAAFGLIQVYRALGGGWQIRLERTGESRLPPPPAAAEKGPIPLATMKTPGEAEDGPPPVQEVVPEASPGPPGTLPPPPQPAPAPRGTVRPPAPPAPFPAVPGAPRAAPPPQPR